jgi:uncharacterized repeat protein (TIGR04076 family)
MKRTIATVVRVTGTCNAGYQVGDEVIVDLDTACIDKEQSNNLCIFALGTILANMGRIRQGEKALALLSVPTRCYAFCLGLQAATREGQSCPVAPGSSWKWDGRWSSNPHTMAPASSILTASKNALSCQALKRPCPA